MKLIFIAFSLLLLLSLLSLLLLLLLLLLLMIGLAVSGLNHLCAPITKLSRGLVELNLARTGITARGVNKLSEALLSNRNIPLNLRILDLSENSFKGEDVPASLATVNLSNVNEKFI